MPELPEVETVVRDLRPLLVGRRLAAVRVGKQTLRRKWQAAWSKAVTGATVTGVSRRGKWIVVELAAKNLTPQPPSLRGRGEPIQEPPLRFGEGVGGGVLSGPRLVVHLGMTGQFTVDPAADPVKDHTHLVFELDGGSHQLRFRDIRRFGSAELFDSPAAVQQYLADKLGPEPDALDAAGFRASVRGSKRPVKAILLDQTVVAGVGNIYADEALHRSGLHPERRGHTLTDGEIDRLRGMVAAVIAEAIGKRGSTIRDYVGGSGLRGGFQDEFRAYGRTGEPCLTCETAIAVVRVAGRSSHYCPACQPPEGARSEDRGSRGRRRAPDREER